MAEQIGRVNSVISAEDLIASVADALQFMSYYHPPDFLAAVHKAYQQEESPAARDALAQILSNSRMCAEGHRPICQDTGIVVAFVRVGMSVRWDAQAENMSVAEMVDEGVRRAYLHPDNILRASILRDPAGVRKNTGDNTPGVVHVDLVPGDTVEVMLAAKGGGSENKSRLAMLNPGANIADWVIETLPGMGAGWCPPGQLGIGIGGTSEQAMLLAKRALMEAIDIHELRARGAQNHIEELRLEIMERANALGIGAQGLGGLSTVLDVKILDCPTHAASLPVGLIPNCAATRHAHFTLRGAGPALQKTPDLSMWPDIDWRPGPGSKRVSLDDLQREDLSDWKPGDTLLLTGKIFTARDAAHRRLQQMVENGSALPPGVDLKNRFLYYVGPVDPVRDEIVGPAGPTTATRMDRYTDFILGDIGVLGMIGKAERGPEAIQAIRKHRGVYLIAVGGAAYLVARAIRSSRIVAFEDLGMEAIHEFEVRDMPVTVAVDVRGNSVHSSGPEYWRAELARRQTV